MYLCGNVSYVVICVVHWISGYIEIILNIKILIILDNKYPFWRTCILTGGARALGADPSLPGVRAGDRGTLPRSPVASY